MEKLDLNSSSNNQLVVEELNNQTEPSLKETQFMPRKKRKFYQKKWFQVLLIVLVVFGLTLGIMGTYTFSVTKQLKKQGLKTKTSGQAAYQAFKNQNLPETKKALDETQNQLTQLEGTYKKLGFYRFVPLARSYYLDGQNGIHAAQAGLSAAQKTVDALVPYADVLGFTGEGSFTGGTVEDRIANLLSTIDKLLPQMDAIQADLQTASNYLNQIDPHRYPQNFRGIPVRDKLTQAQKSLKGASEALSTYRPIIERLPSIAGADGKRKKYLILFQNDNELRPTGGFLTAYAVINVENGKVTAEKSDDIYELDKKFRKKIPIPKELGRYLTTEKYWHLRDMNIYPDFKESMDVFYPNYQTIPGEPNNIDGVVAIDTKFVVHLMDVLGPVVVPGYGTFSSTIDKSCDCPQIIHVLSEIITKPVPYVKEDRKGILGPLMQGLITKSYQAPKNQWPALFESFFTDIGARHVQFYFMDSKNQAAAEKINAAGRMFPPTKNQDFLAIVDANLAGAKSNLYVQNQWYQTLQKPKDGYLTKTIEATYKNPRRADNCNLEAGLLCLNSTLNDWNRVYLPKGSQLINASGYLEKPQVYETDNFTVVDGFFKLQPKGVAKIKLTVKVPYDDNQTYRLYAWKQGGLNPYPFVLNINGNEEKFDLNQDLTYEAKF